MMATKAAAFVYFSTYWERDNGSPENDPHRVFCSLFPLLVASRREAPETPLMSPLALCG